MSALKRNSIALVLGLIAVVGIGMAHPREANANIKIEWEHPDGCSTRMCYRIDNGPLHCYTLHVPMFCGGQEPINPFHEPQPEAPRPSPSAAGKYDVPQDQ